MKSAIGYICVSSYRSAEHYKAEVDAQKAAVQTYAAKNGYNVSAWRIDIFNSSRQFYRPQLDSIFYYDYRKPSVKAVLIAKRDVLSTDIKFYAYYALRFDDINIKLISADESTPDTEKLIDEYKPFVRFIADEERLRISMNCRKGREEKASHGGYSGGRPPFGYTVEKHSLIIVPAQAEIVRKIFQMRDEEKKSYIDIAGKLNELGYLNSKGNPWSVNSIQPICENKKRYQGYYKYGKTDQWIKGEHEPIIGEDKP